jgi:Tfp pilus assembly protein PilO
VTTFNRIMQEKRRLIWPLLVVLVANAAVFALVVYPLSRKVALGQQDADAATLALNNARRDYANARATVTGKAQADTELQKFYKDVLPPDLSGARRITYLPIDRLAREANLRVERQTSDTAAIRDSELARFTQTAVLTGEYRDIRRFIHELETRPEFIVIENVDLSQNENETSRGITVTLQIATYYRTGGNGN